MSCKKELDVGYPQVTIIVIEWTKTFLSGDRKWIELKIRQNSTAKFNQFSWQKPICKIQVLLTINTIVFDHDILVNIWRFRLETVFCYQNCSDLLWEKNVLVTEKNFWNSKLNAENLKKFWHHQNNLFKTWKVRTIHGNRMLFLFSSWRFFKSKNLEQLEFRLEKIIGI